MVSSVLSYSSAAQDVLSLVSGYRNPLSWRLAILQACIDDSGHQSGPVFLLGSLIAPVESWLKLTEEWNRELEERPRVEYFKMQEAIRSVGQFRGTSGQPELVRLRINKLSEIVQRHVTHAFHVAIEVDDFNKLVRPLFEIMEKGNPHELKGITSPYFFLAWSMLRGFDFAPFGDDDLRVVFDEQAADGLRVKDWWSGMAEAFNQGKVKHRIQSTPDFRTDQKFVPLQAANSFAWLQHRAYSLMPLSGLKVDPPTIDEFLGSIIQGRHLLDSETLTDTRNSLADRLLPYVKNRRRQ